MDLGCLGWAGAYKNMGLAQINFIIIYRSNVMQSRNSTAPIYSVLLAVLVSAFLTVGIASPHVHFSIEDHLNRFSKHQTELDQAIVGINQNCNISNPPDHCGPCLAVILKSIEQEGVSSNGEDDNTSSQQASTQGQNSQDNEKIKGTQSQCRIIISKIKALFKQKAALKQQLQAAELKISQQDQDIISHKNSLAICSSLLKECQDKECPTVPPCPPTEGCEKCEEELRATKIALMLSQNQNIALKSKIKEYEESLNSWNKLLISTLPQAGSEVLSLQQFSAVTKTNVTSLATSLNNLLTLANTASDNFSQSSLNYQNQVSSLSDSFVKFIQSTFSFASTSHSSQTSKQCRALLQDYKSAVQSLKQCNDLLTGSK